MTPSPTDKNGISKTGAVRKVVPCDRTCVREGVQRVHIGRKPVNNGLEDISYGKVAERTRFVACLEAAHATKRYYRTD